MEPNSISIRRALPEDVTAIKVLLDSNFDEVLARCHSHHVIEYFKASHSREVLIEQLNWKRVYIAEENGEVVGTGAFANFGSAERPKYVVSNLYIRLDRQKHGIGSLLLSQLIADAREHHTKTYHVPSSRNAVEFYRKAGFEVDEGQPDADEEITWMSMLL